ncbi:MAG: T9SS type A sorting domain-containing protein [Ignavibacteria bacterium]|nr:T9SS type A sorting domain-containing protein [Ignavibacteria bacterium]
MKEMLLRSIVVLLFAASSTAIAQEFAGSESCKNCHSAAYNNWKASGHPYKIQKLQASTGPIYPVLKAQKTVGSQVNYELKSGIPTPPSGLTWDSLGFVLGGYHSNARFLDKEGYIIYGNNRQYNLPTSKWVAYTSGTLTKASYAYSCYKCHTTGPSKTKTTEFQMYPGIEGSWAEAGVGCEGCHGPSKAHTTNPSTKPPKEGLTTCNNCHARDRNEGTTTYPWNQRVEWQARTVNNVSTGFIRHREQGDMMLASKHGKAGFTCATCHDPHKGVYFVQGGLKASASCQTCHPNKQISGHDVLKTKAECTDCHMPFAARNGDQLTPYISEQSTHYWKIITDPVTMFDNLQDIASTATPPVTYKFIKTDAAGMSGVTLDYTCMQCHTDKNVTWASTYAKRMHSGITAVDAASEVPSAYTLGQNYPNPFNPATTISFAIPKSSFVTLKVYSVTGELVSTVLEQGMRAGWHNVTFNAGNLASGVYLYRIQAADFSYARKMVLTR